MDYNGRNHPIAIVFPRGEDDVTSAMTCSFESNIEVRTCLGGDSNCNGMLIYLKGLKTIKRAANSDSIFKVGGGGISSCSPEIWKNCTDGESSWSGCRVVSRVRPELVVSKFWTWLRLCLICSSN